MWTQISNILEDLLRSLGDVIVAMYDLAPYLAIPAIVALAYLLYILVRQPAALFTGIVLIAATWCVAMPGGIDSIKTVWAQPDIEPKYACLQELGAELDYWTGEKTPNVVCDQTSK